MKQLIVLFFSIIFFSLNSWSQHLKKDGTPDMRYRENKSNYSPSSNNTPSSNISPSSTGTTIHLKKDGTPDRRYKENKTAGTNTIATTTPHYNTTTTTGSYKRVKYSYVKREANGRIHRSAMARHEFMKQSGYPHGRPGYVIDHIKPLKKGGCDCPSNMQWQTIKEAKEKDKWE